MSLLIAFNKCGKLEKSAKNQYRFRLFGKTMFLSYEWINDVQINYTISGRSGVLETGEYTRVK